MKKILPFFLLLAFSLVVLAESSLLNLKVNGMHCGGCENKFKASATQIKGIEEVTAVSASEGTATIRYDASLISAEKAIQSLAESTGYTITATTSLGMVQSEGKPAGCCQKGQSTAACKKSEKSCKSKSVE
jgi:Zn2+/Cd2+-exporting ATPase